MAKSQLNAKIVKILTAAYQLDDDDLATHEVAAKKLEKLMKAAKLEKPKKKRAASVFANVTGLVAALYGTKGAEKYEALGETVVTIVTPVFAQADTPTEAHYQKLKKSVPAGKKMSLLALATLVREAMTVDEKKPNVMSAASVVRALISQDQQKELSVEFLAQHEAEADAE